MKEVFAILGIVLIAVFVFVTVAPYTGQVASNYYGVQKIYGGAWKKAATRPSMVGEAYAKQLYLRKLQNYMYSHKNLWDCSYGHDALDSKYPCILDEESGKYCCIVSESGNFNQYGRL